MSKVRINFYIDQSEKVKLDKRAKELNIPYSNIVRRLISDYLLEKDNEEKGDS